MVTWGISLPRPIRSKDYRLTGSDPFCYKHSTMAYLKYYADENRRHKTAESIKLSFDACADLTAWLCKHFGLETNKVTLLDKNTKRFSRVKKTKSWYSSGTNEIVYHPSMLNPLTVVHEVAHYAHNVDRKKRYTEIRAKWELTKEYTDFAGRLRIRPFPMRKEKWHGPEHRAFVEKGIAAVKALPALQRYFAETPEGELARTDLAFQEVLRNGLDPVAAPRNDGDVVAKFFEALPEKLTCPCCKAHIPKQNFGVRVMKRDANGVPVKMRAQSYCKACR